MMTTDNPLSTIRAIDPAALERLQTDLSDQAAAADLLDLGYRTVDSPLGSLLLVASERGLTRVAFSNQDHERVLADLAATVSPRILRAPRRLDPAARELEEYFAGSRRTFDLPLDLTTRDGFRQAVQRLLPNIGYGETVSYTELATRAGRPTAIRAAASACATNPLPVVVPCHRVVRNDGGLGGYLGGLSAKRALLDLEARAVA
ncbi:MAG TPA: methylated-DNA--[protein]-cysteine S-methyltransferase [Microlunatus sp.]|nr:methylated-DNA--[protein]-cysteine S-methyltransferase [Microlunatus sp.]